MRIVRWCGALALCASMMACGPSSSSEQELEHHTARFARVGAWNIRKLGHGEAKDFDIVADVIADHFDVIAIVEVMQKGGTHPGYDRLLEHLGDAWSGMVTSSPRPDTSSGNAEFYAVVYRDRLISPCDGWTSLRYVDDPEDRFVREPAFSCMSAGFGEPGVGSDFMLVAYHAVYDGGSVVTIGAEIAELDEVLAEVARAKPDERDIYLVGDLNLTPKQLASATPLRSYTVGDSSTLSKDGRHAGHLLDHLIVHDMESSGELAGPAQILDVRDYASSDRAFHDSVSDHLPLAFSLRIDQRDDDG